MHTLRSHRIGAIVQTLHWFLLPFSLLIYASGILLADAQVLYFGVASLFCSNILFACVALRQRLVFLFFHLGLFLFLLSRPTIALFRGISIQSLSITYEAAAFSLALLFCSLICLRLGALVAERFLFRTDLGIFPQESYGERGAAASPAKIFQKDNPQLASIRVVSALLFLVCFLASVYFGYLKLQQVSGLTYLQYYLTDFSETGSIFVRTLETWEPFALAAFLAAFPRKRPATVVLVLHVLTTIPNLIIGGRTAFVLAVLFAVLYYFLRDSLDGKGSWIGRLEKTLLIVGIPTGILAMGLLTYTRSNLGISQKPILTLLADSIYSQGVSYTVLGKGFVAAPQIAAMGFKGYSFGALTDYFVNGPFGTFVLGNTPILGTNSVQQAVEGTSYAHAISYFMHPGYLTGQGWGSSYLLELNQDFGFAGVAGFSLVLGALLRLVPRLLAWRWLVGVIALLACMSVFYIPRSTTIEIFEFVWTPQFWAAILVIVGAARLLRVRGFPGRAASEAPLLSAATHHRTALELSATHLPPCCLIDAKIGEVYEHAHAVRPVRHHSSKNRLDSRHRGTLRWLGAGS
jgi:oligosaccharide repeat unit polymerase